MEAILAPGNRIVLEQFAWSNVLLAFDFDGTLSPIVAERDAARMRPETERIAADLSGQYPCAIVSGRSYDDLTRLTDELPSWTVWPAEGSPAPAGRDPRRPEVLSWKDWLAPRLDPSSGIEVEDKGTRLSLHYRRSRTRKKSSNRIAELVRGLRGARVIHGKQVVHLLPPGEPHKGMALDELRRQSDCDTALYVGDDETDEDVFASEQDHLLTIRIGRSARSQAQYYLEDQTQVDDLMKLLLELRERRGRRREVG